MNSMQGEEGRVDTPSARKAEYREVPIGMIQASSNNPRKRFDIDHLQDLANSIALQGVLEPIVLRVDGYGFTIIAGERRFRAASMAGLETIPAMVRECSEVEALEMTIVENLQRKDLDAIEEAEGYQLLANLTRMTQQQIAERVHRSPEAISNSMRLLKLPEFVRAQISAGTLTGSHGKALVGLAEEAEIIRFVNQVHQYDWTSRKLEAEISSYKRALQDALQPRIPETEETGLGDAETAGQGEDETGTDDTPVHPVTSGPVETANIVDELKPAADVAVTDWRTSSAVATPESTATQPAAAAAPAPVVTDTPQQAAVKNSSSSDAGDMVQMVTVAVPVALDDWCYEAGFDTITIALEHLRRFCDLAERIGMTGPNYLTKLENEN